MEKIKRCDHVKDADQIVFTVDVGFNIGVAVWGLFEGVWKLGQTYQKSAPVDFNITSKYKYIGAEFDKLVNEYQPDDIIIEGAEFRQGGKGTVTAKSGALVKLCYMVGVLMQVGHNYDMEVTVIQASDWKGQLPDPIVLQRLNTVMLTTFKAAQQHKADAIGIGCSLLLKNGLFK